MLGALILAAAAVTFTPKTALDQARAMLRFGLSDDGDVRFRHVELRSVGPDMYFCGQVNTRTEEGGLTGWRDLLIIVSNNPEYRGVATGRQPSERSVIAALCSRGELVDKRDYSAALDPHY